MFGSLGGAEILLILVLALLLFGPRKLPDVGRMVGRAVGEFRRASLDLKTSLEQEVDAERRDTRASAASAGAEAPRGAVARGALPEGGSAENPESAGVGQPESRAPETTTGAPTRAAGAHAPGSDPEP